MSYIFQIGAVSFLLGIFASLIFWLLTGWIGSSFLNYRFRKSVIAPYHEELRKMRKAEDGFMRDCSAQQHEIDNFIAMKKYYPDNIFYTMLEEKQQKFNKTEQSRKDMNKQISDFKIPDDILSHYNKYYRYTPASSWPINDWIEYY